jgi:signal transduction histidine kinase
MFNSLRSRLLLSYGIVIALLVFLFGIGSFTALLKNPQLYEASALKLRTTQQDLRQRYSTANMANYQEAVDRVETRYGVRAIISTFDGEIIADSGLPEKTAFRLFAIKLDRMVQKNEIVFLRDRDNGVWLGLADQINPDAAIILAIRRPRLGVVAFFTSELLRSFILSALSGLALAVLLAILMSYWISAPVRKIELATHSFATGKRQTIPLEGPLEIKQLASSFNLMSDQVQAAQLAQQDLVMNVSHELKTPLTSILGFSQAILDGVIQSPPDLDRTIRLIHTEANRMGRLVQDLVVLARLESGQELQIERVSPGPLLQYLAEKFQLSAAQAGINLRVEMPTLPSIRVDADRLTQVISNLLDNSVKYTPSSGTVVLSANAYADHIEIRVSDDGPGIPSEAAGRIFERFYRVEGTSEKSGSGLGLAISKQIVAALGGEIHYKPALPHGSIFTISLPTAK